jgi:hypothetical protein
VVTWHDGNDVVVVVVVVVAFFSFSTDTSFLLYCFLRRAAGRFSFEIEDAP